MFEYGLQITFTILDWKEVDGSVTVSDNIYHQLKKKKKTSMYFIAQMIRATSVR